MMDDSIFDLTKLLLQGQRNTLPRSVVVVAVHITLELQPLVVAFPNDRESLHLVNDFVHQSLLRFWEIPVGLLTRYSFKLLRQFPHELLRFGMIADTVLHRLCQFQHCFPCFVHQFITGLRLLLGEMEHLVVKDIVGENTTDDKIFIGMSSSVPSGENRI